MTTENETQTNEEQQCNSKLTTVKTIYARAAILLLAANFCLTGYCLVKLSENQQEGFGTSQGISGATAVTKKEPTTETLSTEKVNPTGSNTEFSTQGNKETENTTNNQ